MFFYAQYLQVCNSMRKYLAKYIILGSGRH